MSIEPGGDPRDALHPDTLAVGYGHDPQAAFGAVKPPIVLTSTFAYPSAAAAKQAHKDYGSAARIGPLRKLRTLLGTHLDPFTSWLALRSLETFPLRNARANANAAIVATFLRDHPKVAGVSYLGFLEAGTPARAVFERQCSGAGSTFSFRIRGGEAEAFAMLDRLRVFRMAVSLGGTESLICHSASTTHYSVPPAVRADVGVDDATLRIAIGIEHPDDLVADLASALDALP